MEASLIQNVNHRTEKSQVGIQPALIKLKSPELEINVPTSCHPPKLRELQWTESSKINVQKLLPSFFPK